MFHYTVNHVRTGLADCMVTLVEPGDGQVQKDVIFVCRIYPAAQRDISEQQQVTGFNCVSVVGWLIVYQDGNYLYPDQYSQTHLLIADWILPPLGQEHSHGKTAQ